MARSNDDRIALLEEQVQTLRDLVAQLSAPRNKKMGHRVLNASAAEDIPAGGTGDVNVYDWDRDSPSDPWDAARSWQLLGPTIQATNFCDRAVKTGEKLYLIDRPWDRWEIISHCGPALTLFEFKATETFTNSDTTFAGRVTEVKIGAGVEVDDDVTIWNFQVSTGARNFYGDVNDRGLAEGPINGTEDEFVLIQFECGTPPES